jgi:putative membrane-bound dehydrogenase-like protein
MYPTRLAFLAFLAVTTLASERTSGEDFPRPRNTEPSTSLPVSPAAAAAGFRAPEGFRVSVFAAEPDVQNPIAMAWDRRGRLWVAENFTYAEQTERFDLRLRDRVLIFEDANGDGRFDRRTVFSDSLQRLASVELGRGGVWLLCPPVLLFVPDRDGDDVADGPAEVVLDGFGVATENHHTFANGLKWGPDGWLYGRCGASSPGQIGTRGTPDALRVPLRGGVWRYQPRTRRFEVLCHGTTNPWGHDWNALGEAFFINTVNGHLWHVIPGAHFVRPHTIEPNPRVYTPIDQHADHWHWDHSKELVLGAPGAHDSQHGGGHAHSGMTIYLADQWPESFRGRLLTLNFHGRRVNVERLEREGSGYAGRHEPDILFAADPWFRGIDLGYGPDGGVFLLDWSDTGDCHDHSGVHRTSGRIFKVTHGAARPSGPTDISRLSEGELLALHRHGNEWFVRQARSELADRFARGQLLNASRTGLLGMFSAAPLPEQKLRALWSLHAIGGTSFEFLVGLLDHEHESVRAWAIRLLTDEMPLDTIFSTRIGPDIEPPAGLLERLEAQARDDRSGLVRLVLASTLQRLPVNCRAGLARALLGRAEDSHDHNLPPLIWTGLIPLAAASPESLVALAADCRMPEVVGLCARRLAEDIESRPSPVEALLSVAATRSESVQRQVVLGFSAALTGWRKARKPAGWDAVAAGLSSSGDAQLRERVRELNVLFGDGRALEEVRRLALDEKSEIEVRKVALLTLIEGRPRDLRSICERLLRVRFLNSVAVQGLALFDDPAIGRSLAQSFRAFHPSERSTLVGALVSRPAFARALLDQIAAGRIPRSELGPFHARQILSLGDPALSKRLSEVWGELRTTPTERRRRIEDLKKTLSGAALAEGNPSQGRAVYQRVCGSCHRLYGEGGEVGPDLTGSGRGNLDYLLENLVDPSAAVSADFRMVAVAMTDGRILNGLIKRQSARTLTLQTQTAAVTLDRSEIEEVRPSQLSLMPEGLLDTLSPTEVRNLVAYLAHPAQVPLPSVHSAPGPAGR